MTSSIRRTLNALSGEGPPNVMKLAFNRRAGAGVVVIGDAENHNELVRSITRNWAGPCVTPVDVDAVLPDCEYVTTELVDPPSVDVVREAHRARHGVELTVRGVTGTVTACFAAEYSEDRPAHIRQFGFVQIGDVIVEATLIVDAITPAEGWIHIGPYNTLPNVAPMK